MSDIYNITAEHPDDCDCAHCYDPVRRVADLQTQRDTLARALLESQAALAAANARAKELDDEATMLAKDDLATTEQVLRAVRVERDALRAQAETLRRERDEARGQMAVERRQRERCEQEIAEAATLRESVRDLVDGLREAESVLDVIRQADMLREHAYDDNENGRSTSDDLRATLAAIRPLLAKHTAPAPTPAGTKEDDRG